MSERPARFSLPPIRKDGKCRGCADDLPKGRKSWCSDRCRDSHWIKASGSYARHHLFQRDHGICSICGLDTVALKREYIALSGRVSGREVWWAQHPVYPEQREFLKQHGITYGRISSDWWDADHVQAVVEGGGSCGIDNLRTLCIPCHKSETAALRKRLARSTAPTRGRTEGET